MTTMYLSETVNLAKENVFLQELSLLDMNVFIQMI